MQFGVYEVLGHELLSYLGTVEAESREEAIEKAHEQFGGPIVVEEY